MSSPVLSPLQCAVQLRASVLQLARRLRPGLEAEGMGTLKLSVLSRLGRQGAMSPTELARGEGVRLQSLTRLIAELEAEGWVRRSDDPADGRRSLLAPTPAGVACLRSAGPTGTCAQCHRRLSCPTQRMSACAIPACLCQCPLRVVFLTSRLPP